MINQFLLVMIGYIFRLKRYKMKAKNQLVWVERRWCLILRGFLKCVGVVVALSGFFG